jgi:hypothetical protein
LAEANGEVAARGRRAPECGLADVEDLAGHRASAESACAAPGGARRLVRNGSPVVRIGRARVGATAGGGRRARGEASDRTRQRSASPPAHVPRDMTFRGRRGRGPSRRPPARAMTGSAGGGEGGGAVVACAATCVTLATRAAGGATAGTSAEGLRSGARGA